MSNWWWDWKPVFWIVGVIAGIVALAVTVVLIIGIKPDNGPEAARDCIQHLTYVQDEKTGLCFVHHKSGLFGGPDLANVPCTEAVLREIAAGKQKQ